VTCAMPRSVIRAVALIKQVAAEVNAGLGLVPAPLAEPCNRRA